MPKLSDFHIFSDIDGTLFSHKTGEIPRENITAIERFVNKGGKFALATGRSGAAIKSITSAVKVNFPCICINGSGLYDTCKEEYLYTWKMPDATPDYVKQIISIYPHFDASVLSSTGYYYVADSAKTIGKMKVSNYISNENYKNPIEGDIYKAVFFVPEADCPKHIKEIEAMNFAGVDIMSSDRYFLELMPSGVSKGSALKKLCEITGIDIRQTVAVGDYFNDADLLRTAGSSYCVQGAPPELAAITDGVLCSCEDGAIAELIEKLEKLCE